MNKNFIITLLASTAIIFVFQFLSWTVTSIHKNTFKAAQSQNTILSTLTGMEDGVYMVPNASPDASREEQEKVHQSMVGKPWAVVTYHKSMCGDMTMPMILGFLFNLFAVAIVLFIIGKTNLSSFNSKFFVSFLFGVFLCLQSEMMSWNWFHTPTHFIIPEIIDGILSWTCAGLVIAWLYKPNQVNS